MNVALALALFTATVTLGAAVAHLAVSRAPGWRASRAFATIAFTGMLYCLGNIVVAEPDLPDSLHHLAVQLNYLWASLHVLAWFPWLFGGSEGRWELVPRPLRIVAGFTLIVSLLFAVTGLHLQATPFEVPVEWARVVYHRVHTTWLGDLYGYFLVTLLMIPYSALVYRAARGERTLVPVAVGFTIYIACAIIEVLVANGELVGLSPADLGFLAVIVPTSIMLLRRFIDDARRLNELTGQLAGEVRDRTFERDRAQGALLESERLAALGRLAAGVGHEINNPLTYLQLALDRVGAHLENGGAAPPDVRQSLEDARDGAWRIQRVVEGLRTYSRRHAEREPLDLREVARAALKVAQPRIRHVAMLETQMIEIPLVLGDEPRLVQALVNLLANAAEAVSADGGNGRIRLCTGVTTAGEPWFEVEDDGPGIPLANLTRVGEPYFTTRGPSGGLGLGLFVTRGIVDAHGGRLELSAVEPHGTLARIVLPPLTLERASAAAAGAAGSAGSHGPPAIKRRVRSSALPAAGELAPRPSLLLVDDEPLVLRLLVQLLENEWEVVPVASGEVAYELLCSRTFEVVLCDVMMSGLSGIQLAERVARRDPALRERMVFMTGGAITREAEEFLARPDVTAVNKPMNFEQLRELLRDRSGHTPLA